MPYLPRAARAALPITRPANGFANFRLPCKKVVLEYCEVWQSNEGLREFISRDTNNILKFARENPSVEFIVKKRPFKHPILRGLYREWHAAIAYAVLEHVLSLFYLLFTVNNRDKVICVRNMKPEEIKAKLQLLVDSSGEKLKLEKGHPVKSTNESVRGVLESLSITTRTTRYTVLTSSSLLQASTHHSTRRGKAQTILESCVKRTLAEVASHVKVPLSFPAYL